MINKVIFSLDINGDSLIIKVDDKKSKTISLKNKNINTMEIYNMLKYDKSNEYILNSSKIPDEEINGKDQEIKRLYNYTYDLLSQIIDAVNDENKRIAKEEKEGDGGRAAAVCIVILLFYSRVVFITIHLIISYFSLIFLRILVMKSYYLFLNHILVSVN